MCGRMGSMPSAHRNALKKLLAVTATSEEERTKLIDLLADLHVSQNETRAVLLGDDQPK